MLRFALLLGLAGFCSAVTGCGTQVSAFNGNTATDTDVIAEGTIYHIKYDLGDGKTGGFTRLDNAAAVPGGNGSWNVDARGKLTAKFLIITYANRSGLGPHVIPVERLYDVQFGDGDLVQVKHDHDTDHGAHEHNHH